MKLVVHVEVLGHVSWQSVPKEHQDDLQEAITEQNRGEETVVDNVISVRDLRGLQRHLLKEKAPKTYTRFVERLLQLAESNRIQTYIFS